MSAHRPGRPQPWVRMLNALVAAAMIVLFLVHGVGNSFQLMGHGSLPSKGISHALVALAAVHVVLGVWLTVQTLRAQREAGTAYPRLNARFWAVRVSGLAIAALIVFHALVFWRSQGAVVRLVPFGEPELVAHVLLVVAIAVHVLASMLPLMVSLGVGAPGPRAADLMFVAALLLLLMVVAFVMYYLRWSVV